MWSLSNEEIKTARERWSALQNSEGLPEFREHCSSHGYRRSSGVDSAIVPSIDEVVCSSNDAKENESQIDA